MGQIIDTATTLRAARAGRNALRQLDSLADVNALTEHEAKRLMEKVRRALETIIQNEEGVDEFEVTLAGIQYVGASKAAARPRLVVIEGDRA